MYYYFIIALQGFCIYHLIKNRNRFYWIFAIIFLPLIGSIIYIVTQVFNKRDNTRIKNNITTVIDPSRNLKALENKLHFSDTYQNRINLADAYQAAHNYPQAIFHYNKALEDTTQNDFYVKSELVKAYYYSQNYDQVIAISEPLADDRDYEKSDVPFFYGMALAEENRNAEAEIQFKNLDRPYCNYNERLAYAQFLVHIERRDDAKKLLEELYEETENMTKMNRDVYKTTIIAIKNLKSSL